MCCTLSTFVDYTIANTPLLIKNAPHLLHFVCTTICLHFPTLCLHNSVSTLFPHSIYTIASQKCATFATLCLHHYLSTLSYTLLTQLLCPHSSHTSTTLLLIKNAPHLLHFLTPCLHNYLSPCSYTFPHNIYTIPCNNCATFTTHS